MAALRPRRTLSALSPSWKEGASWQLQNRRSAWRSARGVMFVVPLAALARSLPKVVLLLFWVQFCLLVLGAILLGLCEFGWGWANLAGSEPI